LIRNAFIIKIGIYIYRKYSMFKDIVSIKKFLNIKVYNVINIQ